MSETLEKQLPVVSFESKDDTRKYRSKKRKERKIKKEKGEKVKKLEKREYHEESESESGSDGDNSNKNREEELPIKKVKKEIKVESVDQSERFSSILGSILNKQPTKQDGPILAKYKKADQQLEAELKEEKELKKKMKEKAILEEKDHRPIEILITSSERDLMKTAKRGVIKLFNAVAKHQKESNTINIEDEPKLSKNQFLDKLKSNSSKSSVSVKKEEDEDSDEDNNGQQWDGLNEDYMLDANNNQWESYDNQE
ncbi:hypothetical protein PPL_09447 [Heterostelium album PN500]|uniref:RRP15-like protein n=1 Tax=Heterostelium pallidum (strain ATCC 26659 / Pp 5 / PN500) TaxID=670386 RepID=D3BPH8_HETP5|nr:hypothetical protein PPL_09447 [Heterostelium album PN500]EFA76696.1 hypothetical protein PPL_09447 [Heterostelium album PN500]|eukprot:XP_020428828.1 hypothetical protein PPL_09447 [Heterostelium album PN500]